MVKRYSEPTCKLTIDECVGIHKQLLHDWIPLDNEECHRAFRKIEEFLDSLVEESLHEKTNN